MNEQFVVSAPGKVIVFGEHAVVHGKTAIAAAISLRSYLMVTPGHKDSDLVTLELPDLNFQHGWRREHLPWEAFQRRDKVKKHYERVTVRDQFLLEALRPHVETVSQKASEAERHLHQMSASTFLYLLLSLSSPHASSCVYTLRSTIPTGAGLGSSASISVCLSTALLHQADRLPKGTSGSADENDQALEFINNWAYVGELCIHGNPSGLDNTVATKGKAVLFKRFDKSQPPLVKPLHNFPLLNLLLVDTRQPRSTLTEVAKVQALKDQYPTTTEHMLDAIGDITEQVHELIERRDFDPGDAESIQQLGQLVRMNQGILAGLGVSHPKLDSVKHAMDTNELGWTKLTGAGGGGCAFTLLRKDFSQRKLEQVLSDFKQQGFGRYEVLLGSIGVGVLDKPGYEISRDSLLKADSHAAIEALVGVGSDGTEKGWRFWE